MARWSWGWVEGAAPTRGQMVAAVAAAAVARLLRRRLFRRIWRRCGKGSSRYTAVSIGCVEAVASWRPRRRRQSRQQWQR
jgi:hypothetical protein